MRRARRQDGQALIEAALVIPMVLLIAIGIFEFGRAYQTWQILTNAAREGARMAIVPSPDLELVQARVKQYLIDGQLSAEAIEATTITVNRNASINVTLSTGTVSVSASQVTVDYPFNFVMLGPVVRLVTPSSTVGNAVLMQASAVMRNEM